MSHIDCGVHWYLNSTRIISQFSWFENSKITPPIPWEKTHFLTLQNVERIMDSPMVRREMRQRFGARCFFFFLFPIGKMGSRLELRHEFPNHHQPSNLQENPRIQWQTRCFPDLSCTCSGSLQPVHWHNQNIGSLDKGNEPLGLSTVWLTSREWELKEGDG